MMPQEGQTAGAAAVVAEGRAAETARASWGPAPGGSALASTASVGSPASSGALVVPGPV